MGILTELTEKKTWEAFYEYKLDKRHFSNREGREMLEFIETEGYLEIVRSLIAGGSLDYPEKKLINKSGTGKKRVVYSFKAEEMMVLKCMTYLLYRYDDKISPSCYSFRRNSTAKCAFVTMLEIPGLGDKYCCKADISNYFNSIPSDRLCGVLEEIITDDGELLAFLKRFLSAGKSYDAGRLIEEERGAMAGIPLASFFANIYLKSLDEIFESKGVPYFRYSDDILFFADSEEELKEYYDIFSGHIESKGLSLNRDKLSFMKPGEAIEFLGFKYRAGKVGLSEVTLAKMKGKIRRKAHSLYRWRLKKEVPFDKTAGKMIEIFNRKFYEDEDDDRFTWSRWFFPVLTSDAGLKILDDYLVEYIRFLSSGRHYKGNYRISYEHIKELGFKSLVNEYYNSRE